MNRHLAKALTFFLPDKEILSHEPLGDGNVNDTWLIKAHPREAFVLQRLNPHVFRHPEIVQNNLFKVCCHLEEALANNHTNFIPLRLLTNPQGQRSYIADDNACWRLLSYIGNSRTINCVRNPDEARETGRTLGFFHTLLSSLDSSSLADPLPGFHCTPLYLDTYDRIAAHPEQPESEDCLLFIQGRRHKISLLENARKQGILRQQVIHSDPKIANFLFAGNSNNVISLIDLDTVKPGLLLHDIGDWLRSCCNPSGEDIQDQKNDTITFNPLLFSAALSGYLENGCSLLTPADGELLIDSVWLISFELGLRFYSDYINGNQYFKVSSPRHNLFRARRQFALVQSIEEQYSVLKKTCSTLLAACWAT